MLAAQYLSLHTVSLLSGRLSGLRAWKGMNRSQQFRVII